jgi:hypothetical protein
VSQANLELLAQGFAGLGKDEPARMSELLAPDWARFVWADEPRSSAQTPRHPRVSAGISTGRAARCCRRRQREIPANTGLLLGSARRVGLVAPPLKIEVSAVRVRLSPSPGHEPAGYLVNRRYRGGEARSIR